MTTFTDKNLIELGRLVADGINAMERLDGADDYAPVSSGVKFDCGDKQYVVTVSKDWPDARAHYDIALAPSDPAYAEALAGWREVNNGGDIAVSHTPIATADRVTEADLSH